MPLLFTCGINRFSHDVAQMNITRDLFSYMHKTVILKFVFHAKHG